MSSISDTTIMRTVRDKDHKYTVINTTFANDERLSWEARGVLAYLLTKPDDWQTYPRDLIKRSKAGRDKVYTVLKEMELAGYLQRFPDRNREGQIERWVYHIYETPLHLDPFERPTRKRKKPDTENPEVDDFGLDHEDDLDDSLSSEPFPDFPDPAKPDLENPHMIINGRVPHTDSQLKLNQKVPSIHAAAIATDGQPAAGDGWMDGPRTWSDLRKTDQGQYLWDCGVRNFPAARDVFHLPLSELRREWAAVQRSAAEDPPGLLIRNLRAVAEAFAEAAQASPDGPGLAEPLNSTIDPSYAHYNGWTPAAEDDARRPPFISLDRWMGMREAVKQLFEGGARLGADGQVECHDEAITTYLHRHYGRTLDEIAPPVDV